MGKVPLSDLKDSLYVKFGYMKAESGWEHFTLANHDSPNFKRGLKNVKVADFINL